MTTETAKPEELNQEQIVNTFKAMRAELQRMAMKIGDLENEKEEHKLVIETLEPLDGQRACHRLMNGVLVKRTVAEVLPSLKQNHVNLAEILERMLKSFQEKDKQTKEYQEKYKIRIEQNPKVQ